jgi:heme/copper-type cytochrome/quinol oxidase subunit 2
MRAGAKPTGRVVALVALVVLTGIALRGHLPGDARAADEPPSNSPAALIAVIAVLVAAVVIITIAIVATLRQPRPPRQGSGPLDTASGGERFLPSWRFVLIALGVLLAWLIAVVLLLRLTSVLDVHDQTAATAPTSAPSTLPGQQPPPPPPPEQQEQGDVFWFLFVTTVFMLVVWVAGIAVALRRHRGGPRPVPIDDSTPAPATEPAGPALAVAAERGLAAMEDLSREPREAIIACYAAMEEALANAPGAMPQDSDTPSEVLARAVEHDAIHPGTATDLVELFAEARFSPHVMNEGHREIAVRALELVLAELRSAA